MGRGTSSTADPSADIRAGAEWAVVLQTALEKQPTPVTITRLRGLVPFGFRDRPAVFRQRVEALADSHRVWLFPVGGSLPPLVWDRSPEVFAEGVVLNAVAVDPLSRSQLEKKTRLRLRPVPKAVREEVVDRLIAAGRLFSWPKKPRGRTELLAGRPPDPQVYLDAALKAFDKAVNAVTRSLAAAGLPPAAVQAAALTAIKARGWAQGYDEPLPGTARPDAAMTDDAAVLETVAERMAAIDPRSRSGAPVLIGELRPAVDFLFPSPAAFDAALVRLERAGKISLLRYDPALSAKPLGPERLVSDGRFTYSGVSLR